MSTQTLEQTELLPDGMLAESQLDDESDNQQPKPTREANGRLLPGTVLPGGGRPAGSPNTSKLFITGEISENDWETIKNMERGQLLAMIKAIGGACWGLWTLNEEERKEAADFKLYTLGMASNEVHKAIPSLKEWRDRTTGKAAQSIQLTVKDEGLDKLSTEKLLRLAALLDEPVLISPMPGKLED